MTKPHLLTDTCIDLLLLYPGCPVVIVKLCSYRLRLPRSVVCSRAVSHRPDRVKFGTCFSTKLSTFWLGESKYSETLS